MKKVRYIFKKMLLISIFATASVTQAAVIFEDGFESYTDNTSFKNTTDWTSANQVFLESNATECYTGNQCSRIDYIGSGTEYYTFRHSVASHNLGEMYGRLYFKIRKEGIEEPLGGIKFFKWFGKIQSGANYANTTFNLGGVTASPVDIHGLNYGKGSSVSNDTQAEIRMTEHQGSDFDSEVIVNVSSNTFYPIEDTWYCVEMYVKYNNDGLRDGEYKIWIDGVLRLHATNVKNRHDDNIRELDRIAIGDYANKNVNTWSIWYDNVVFSDEYIGTANVGGTTPPTLTQITPIQTPTNDNTPDYTFSSNKAGTIAYGGDCSSDTTSVINGNNNITLNSLADGTYSNCTITVTDTTGHTSDPLSIHTFTINSSPTSSTKADVDLSGTIDIIDALLTFRNSLELDMTATTWKTSATGDSNCDGVSNSVDVRLILRDSLDLDMSGTGWCVTSD